MSSAARPGRPTVFRRLAASLAAGLVVAVATHVAATVIFFLVGGAQAGTMGTYSDYFSLGSVILFVLMSIAGGLGVYRWRVLSAVVALVLAVVSAVVGTFIQISLLGTALTNDLIAQVFSLLSTTYLVFNISAALVGLGWAPRVFRAIVGAEPTGERRIALVRRPADNLAEGLTTHIDRVEIDPELAETQWDGYVSALSDAGWTTDEVEHAPSLADSVFVEDAVVLFGRTAVLTNPGTPSRTAELAGAEAAVRRHGFLVERIEAPGTLDGGDVLKVGMTVYVGRGGRTNAEGVRQLRALLAPLAYSVIAVPLTKVLHLKSAVTALPDGTVIGYPPLVDDPTIFDRFLAVPEEAGAHVVVLAADTVLMASSAPRSVALVEDLGYRVIVVDISEFEKLEGCVTCLSVRVR